LPVAEAFYDYAATVHQQFVDAWCRVKVDYSNESLNKMVRNAEKAKIPYILVVWEQEVTDTSVSVREFRSKEQYELPLWEFVEKVKGEVEGRVL
jgi:threonyl-tRNA synthetase